MTSWRLQECRCMSDGTQLVRHDSMCSAIAAAYSVDEVKDIRE
jgi:hypothetical protein